MRRKEEDIGNTPVSHRRPPERVAPNRSDTATITQNDKKSNRNKEKAADRPEPKPVYPLYSLTAGPKKPAAVCSLASAVWFFPFNCAWLRPRCRQDAVFHPPA